jgi:hypothetical protein
MGPYSNFSKFLRVLGYVAGSKTSVLLSGTSMIASLLIGSWYLLVLGLFICTGFIGWRLRNPAAWREALQPGKRSQWQLPCPGEVPEPLVSTVLSVRASCSVVLRTLQETPPDLRRRLSFVPLALQELEACAGTLVHRMAGTVNYLRLVRRETLENEISLLAEAIKQSVDVEKLHDLGATLSLRERQLQFLRDIQQARSRSEARLSRVVAAIEGMPARMVRLQVLNEELRDGVGNDLEGTLARVDHDLLGLEEVLAIPDEMAEFDASASKAVALLPSAN